MRRDDPEAYRSEVEGEFRTGASTFFDPQCLEACVAVGRHDIAPLEKLAYRAFVDPSGGSKDDFSIAIGHADGERTVVDLVRGWTPPFNPTGVVAEIASILKTYGITGVTGDRYAGEWPREQFRLHGIMYQVSDMDRSKLYLEMLPRVNATMVELPDDDKLSRQLRNLERKRGTAGRDRVDHRPGEHDDLANAVAGLVALLAPSGAHDPLRHVF